MVYTLPNDKLIKHDSRWYYNGNDIATLSDINSIQSQINSLGYVTGTYTGTDSTSWRFINVGFTPRYVHINTRYGDLSTYYNGYSQNAGMSVQNYSTAGIQIITNGFAVRQISAGGWGDSDTDSSSDRLSPFIYVAFK